MLESDHYWEEIGDGKERVKPEMHGEVISEKRDEVVGNWRSFLDDARSPRYYDQYDEGDSLELLNCIEGKASNVDYVFSGRRPGRHAFVRRPFMLWGGNGAADWWFQYISVCLVVNGLKTE
ncbi:unnamed protein product [Vitrella brassicaformis CCMP3155]|uniref:Uncharacterized protein n=1 Tax=Vitrella brassicaformis (strain CCMP3155) TaxID=1169540 RepID=A0A0G4ETK8_VITBC|nr:unnamed protein product [Vitrella brassicaformis CCMP3155]|eukprot:CEM01646.1 unnamed protein product [Vitrella brassicaformis CCMP3155]